MHSNYKADDAYLELLHKILHKGRPKGDRTGTGTFSLFGEQLRFDLRRGFPLLTTKKLPLRWIAEELFWFLSGSCDEGDLREKGVDIWKEWATEEQCARFGREAGDLGPIYGRQWRRFGNVPSINGEPVGIDQIRGALHMLANKPESRRILVTGWNPAEATQVALPPCHTMFQFETHARQSRPIRMPDGRRVTVGDPNINGHQTRVLSCHMYQRSADMFLGVPFNIASYALLTHMFAHVLGYEVGDLVISFGDVHIYTNHVEQVDTQLSRAARVSPTININADHAVPESDGSWDSDHLLASLLAIQWGHIELNGYNPHPKISAPVAV